MRSFRDIPSEYLFNRISLFRLPDEAIQGAATFCAAIGQGEFNFPSTDLQTVLGKEPESVKDFLKAAYQL